MSESTHTVALAGRVEPALGQQVHRYAKVNAPRRDLPDMAFSVEADIYVATYVIYADPADDARYAEWDPGQTAELAAGPCRNHALPG